MVIQLTIDGIDLTGYLLTSSVEDSLLKTIDTANILLDYRATTLLNNFYGKTVLVTEGIDNATERYIFRGVVRGVNNKTLTIELECKNRLQQLDDREVTATFDSNIDVEAGIISEIVKTLVTEEDFGGMTADDDSIENSGTDTIVKQYICNADKIFERVMWLADTLGWQFYYKASDDKIYFEELGRNTNANVLRFDTSGTSNLLDIPKYDNDLKDLVTRVNVAGAKQLQTFTETFNGTGVATTFPLTYTPSQETNVTISGVSKIRYQLDGVSSSGDYYVDVINNNVIFNTAPAVGTNNVVVIYTSLRPTQVREVNDDAETLYLNGDFREVTYSFTDIQSVDDATTRAKAILDKLSHPTTNCVVQVSKGFGAVYPGERIRLVDTINGVDQFFIVRSVTRKFPSIADEISLGDDRLFKRPTKEEIVERLTNLEKQILQNTGIIVNARRSDKYLRPDIMQSDIQTTSATGTLWGTGGWSTDSSSGWNVNGFGTPVLLRRVWPSDMFWHDGADANLIDADNTDAYIDTTLQEIRAE